MISYSIKNYGFLRNIGKISNEAMELHFKLYEGYVKNTNLLIEKMNSTEVNTPEWNEMHRRFGWEFNGMRLHELFFDSLSVEEEGGVEEGGAAAGRAPEGEILNKIIDNFGSVENWMQEFVAISKIRGMGWVMLVQDNKSGSLINTWVNEHDAGMLSDVNIILNIDMFEHAYFKDFGTDRVGYLESIFTHINWEVVSERLG